MHDELDNEKLDGLTSGQKALIAARHATIKPSHHRTTFSSQPKLTLPEVAKKAGISPRTLNDARTILAYGTEAEVASVRNGIESIKRIAKTVRKRAGLKRGRKPGSGYKIPPINGYAHLSDALRAAVALERSGMPKQKAREQIGLAFETYQKGRDFILLLEWDGLSEKDAKIVQKALNEVDKTHMIFQPHEAIKPIVRKVWGVRGQRFKSDKKRLKKFDDTIAFLLTTCSTISIAIEIPYLSAQHNNDTLGQIEEAIVSLRELQKRIKETTNG